MSAAAQQAVNPPFSAAEQAGTISTALGLPGTANRAQAAVNVK